MSENRPQEAPSRARIKIADLPLLEDLTPEEMKGIFGGVLAGGGLGGTGGTGGTADPTQTQQDPNANNPLGL
jgi:hypothetical protein